MGQEESDVDMEDREWKITQVVLTPTMGPNPHSSVYS